MFDDIEDNFQAGVDTDANEYLDSSLAQPDERISLVVESQ